MRRKLMILMAVMISVVLIGCKSKDNADYIIFHNRLDAVVHGGHISSVDLESWGDPLNKEKVARNSQIIIDFQKLPNGAGAYDIGVIDENGMNYDFYGVFLERGDTITLISDEDQVTATVTSQDESRRTYIGEVY